MSMIATLRGPNGQILGSVPVDPTKPGEDINAQVRAAMYQTQQNANWPQTQRHAPQYSNVVQDTPNQFAQATVRLRYVQRGANGMPTWAEMVVPCPPGAQPGTYVFVSSR